MARLDRPRFLAFLVLYAAATVATVVVSPFLFQRVQNPLWIVLTLALLAALIAIPVLSKKGRAGAAFTASAVTIACMILVTAVSAFPVLVPSSLDLANSLTAYNASSSPRTLTVMLIIALIGVPIPCSPTPSSSMAVPCKVTGGKKAYGGRPAPVRGNGDQGLPRPARGPPGAGRPLGEAPPLFAGQALFL